jgi:glutamyl-tRNA(Gln) amidotransferase subunit D
MVRGGELKLFRQDYNRVKPEGKVRLDGKFETRVALIKVFPNIQPDVIDSLVDAGYRGIVLEGTGLGHTPEFLFGSIKRAIRRGIPIVMTSQCIWGRVNMKVYSTGRDLLQLGVIPGEDMLPETAYVKLMWLLAKTSELDELRKLMLLNYAGEITSRTRPDIFLKPLIPEGE